MPHQVRLLAISDDYGVRSVIESSLEAEGHLALCVPGPREALNAIQSGAAWDFLLMDAARNKSMDELFSSDLLRQCSSNKLCILSEMGETSWKTHAQKWNIEKVLIKPLLRRDLDKLISSSAIADVVPAAAISSPCAASTPPPLQESAPFLLEELDNQGFFLAASPAMVQMHKNIRILASVDHPVLILGESGVGKEVVARLLHKYHARADKKFINVNTAALPSELLESELFGYEAGAFTGALRAKPGKFELADKGTLLLDEIGEMSPMMQAKLLHVLQDGSFSRLGARCSTQVDVRILAATNVDLEVAIMEKRFREDLYYRLNAFTLTVPSLRERREEIPLLIEQMRNRAASRAGQEPFVFSSLLLEAAQEYHWPGNLRELRNFVTRLLVLQDEESALADLRVKTKAKANETALEPVREVAANGQMGMKGAVTEVKHQMESRMIKDALSASGWNRRRAATNLNISYRALLYKIQQHGLTA
jgi:DNA-binding NtrC family response regulator